MDRAALIALAKAQAGISIYVRPRTLRSGWNKPVIFVPSVRDSSAYCAFIESSLLARQSQVQALAFECNEPIATRVDALLFTGCPIAILRRIISIIVSALNAVLRRWPWPHILQKRLEIIPAIADFDAASAIVWKAFAVWIQAALSYPIPRRTLGRSFTFLCMTVLNRTDVRKQSFSAKASATASHSSTEKAANDVACFTARALTDESARFMSKRPYPDHGQPVKTFSDLNRALRSYSSISHAVHPPKMNGFGQARLGICTLHRAAYILP